MPTSRKRIMLSVIAAMGMSAVFLATDLALATSDALLIRVTIDVKPGDEPTTLEPNREGMVPVAILSTREFDATRVDPATVRAGATGTEAAIFRSAVEDVDGDRDTDMMLLFRVQQMGLRCTGKSITVKGKTVDGEDIEGTEAVTMVGCK